MKIEPIEVHANPNDEAFHDKPPRPKQESTLT